MLKQEQFVNATRAPYVDSDLSFFLQKKLSDNILYLVYAKT